MPFPNQQQPQNYGSDINFSQSGQGSATSIMRYPVDSSLLMWEHEFEDIRDEFEKKLKGLILVYDPVKKKRIWRKHYKPFMNDVGVNSVMMDIVPRMTKAVVLSNYTEDKVNEKMLNFADNFTMEIFMKAPEWGLEYAYYSKVQALVEDMIEAIYRRAIGGEERKVFRQRQSIKKFTDLTRKTKINSLASLTLDDNFRPFIVQCYCSIGLCNTWY